MVIDYLKLANVVCQKPMIQTEKIVSYIKLSHCERAVVDNHMAHSLESKVQQSISVQGINERSYTMFLHDFEKLDDDLGYRTDHHLPFTTLLSVGDSLKTIGEHVHFHLYAVVI